MDELGKALADAVRTGTQLAWPALLVYVGSKLLGTLSIIGGILTAIYLITQTVLRYPEYEVRALVQRYALDEEKRQQERAHWDAEHKHKYRLDMLKLKV